MIGRALEPSRITYFKTGPTSWLSVCSEPGLKWVATRTGGFEFSKYARSLTLGWTKRLKVESNRNIERAPEPDREAAWKYSRGYYQIALGKVWIGQANDCICSAYFEMSYYAAFGIVFRPVYEERLTRHFNRELPDDTSWYALRSVVFASGCLEILSRDPSIPFEEAHKQAWKLFENAISVHTELLITPTGLTAVQALTLMVCDYEHPLMR
jgi:hypothetical protein